jgi:branched-chain amino acid aminotransferase
MPTFIRVFRDRRLHPVEYSAESLADAVQYEPEGIYTVTNTYNTTQVLKFDAHLDRMEDSARRAEIPLKIDRKALRAAVREMILETGFGDVRFRITVPREAPATYIITLEPFKPPTPELLQTGIKVITSPNSARENPAAKTTGWMHSRQALQTALPAGYSDVILTDAGGNLLETLSANFYAILDGALRTAGTGVLPGIAQQIVFEIASSELPISRVAPNIADVPRFAEAFITSSSRGIIPVVVIDETTLGNGTPGPRTRSLRQRYDIWVREHLEEL